MNKTNNFWIQLFILSVTISCIVKLSFCCIFLKKVQSPWQFFSHFVPALFNCLRWHLALWVGASSSLALSPLISASFPPSRTKERVLWTERHLESLKFFSLNCRGGEERERSSLLSLEGIHGTDQLLSKAWRGCRRIRQLLSRYYLLTSSWLWASGWSFSGSSLQLFSSQKRSKRLS